MAKKISEVERLIDFAMSASEDALNSAIQSLVAIRNHNFPVEKKTRKARKRKVEEPPKPDQSQEQTASKRKQKIKDDEPVAVERICSNCKWEGLMIAPEPCPDCGEKTEAK